MITHIKSAIKSVITDAEIYLFGDDGEHFEAIVISAEFNDKPLVKQHQLVMNALKAEFGSNQVHALALKTFTPEKWQASKDKFNLSLAK
jgi:acid stress-induced BolA-like protein IbaG/YrbA